jgi:soluble lytic murein transglycosylase
MIRIPPVIVLAALAGLCIAPVSRAQSLDTQRPVVRDALAAAEAGRLDGATSSALVRHPLYGWVEFASLRRQIDAVSTPQAQAFLKRHEGQAVAEQFRSL